MKLELSESISLILTLPAQRSQNEGHRKIGDKALDLLLEYRELGSDENEKAFNRAMIASVLSAVRAFSVERDRMNGEWKAIENIHQRREKFLEALRNLSPLTEGNYWSKAIAVIVSLGYSIKLHSEGWQHASLGFVISFIAGLVVLELLSKTLEFSFANYFEKMLPVKKEIKWKSESMKKYRHIVEKFAGEAVENHKRYFPDLNTLYGFNIKSDDGVKKMKEALVDRHFYL